MNTIQEEYDTLILLEMNTIQDDPDADMNVTVSAGAHQFEDVSTSYVAHLHVHGHGQEDEPQSKENMNPPVWPSYDSEDDVEEVVEDVINASELNKEKPPMDVQRSVQGGDTWQDLVRDVGRDAVVNLLDKKADEEPLNEKERETLWRLNKSRRPLRDPTAYVTPSYIRRIVELLTRLFSNSSGDTDCFHQEEPQSIVEHQSEENMYPPVCPSYDMSEDDLKEKKKEKPPMDVQRRVQFWRSIQSANDELKNLKRQMADVGKEAMIRWLHNESQSRTLTNCEHGLLKRLTQNN